MVVPRRVGFSGVTGVKDGGKKEKRKDRRENKIPKQLLPAPTASPCPTTVQISRTVYSTPKHHRLPRPHLEGWLVVLGLMAL